MKYLNSMGSCLAAAAMFLNAPLATAQFYDPMAAAHTPPAVTQKSEKTIEVNPELGNLPDTEGAEETYYQCIACHSTAIIKQQHISDERWDYLWSWMIEDQGMYEPDDKTKEIILAYLKQHFSSER